jgi:hypothetical protein
MFAVEILDAKDVRRVAAIIDTADTFDAALTRYAEIAWEDAPAVLLGRTVIVREGDTGDVWAVGSYCPISNDPNERDTLILQIQIPKLGKVHQYLPSPARRNAWKFALKPITW